MLPQRLSRGRSRLFARTVVVPSFLLFRQRGRGARATFIIDHIHHSFVAFCFERLQGTDGGKDFQILYRCIRG